MYYPSDMSDAEWSIIQPYIVEAPGGRLGKPREADLRRVVDGIFYVNRTGYQWRYLPKDYPAWYVVYLYFRRWQKGGKWQTIDELETTPIKRL